MQPSMWAITHGMVCGCGAQATLKLLLFRYDEWNACVWRQLYTYIPSSGGSYLSANKLIPGASKGGCHRFHGCGGGVKVNFTWAPRVGWWIPRLGIKRRCVYGGGA